MDRTWATSGGGDDDDGRAPEASHSHAGGTTMEGRHTSSSHLGGSERFFLGLCPPPPSLTPHPPVFPFPVRGITACYLTHSRAYLKRPYPSPPAHVVTPRSFPGGQRMATDADTGGRGWGADRQSMRKQFPPTRSEWSSFKIVSNVPSRNGALKRVMRRERAAKRTTVPTDR